MKETKITISMEALPVYMINSWGEYLKSLLEEQGVSDGLVLELGCGTGSLTEILADSGYDMIGVDLSADMLDIAMEKREQSGNNILYLLQDMREFELYGTVRAVVSICDSMNYLPCEEDFLQTLKLVNNYLDPEGVFIFDHTIQIPGTDRGCDDRREPGRCQFYMGKYMV